jgi:hypothetical protein
VSSRILNRNNPYTWRWPVRPKHVVSNKGIRRKNSERLCTQTAEKLQKSDLYSATGCWNITLLIYSVYEFGLEVISWDLHFDSYMQSM